MMIGILFYYFFKFLIFFFRPYLKPSIKKETCFDFYMVNFKCKFRGKKQINFYDLKKKYFIFDLLTYVYLHFQL